MGWGQLRGPSWLTGAPLAPPISSLLSRMRGLDVCDDAHRLGVMKKVKGPAQAELGRATPPRSDDYDRPGQPPRRTVEDNDCQGQPLVNSDPR